MSDTDVFTSVGTTLAFNNELNLQGQTLTKTGSGTMAINNQVTLAGGTLNCDQGVCSGSGTIGDSVNNSGGTISPGNSPGVLAIGGDFTQSENGTLLIELGGTDAGAAYDVLEVNGQATLDGILEVSLVDGFAPSAGGTFDIFQFGLTTGDSDDVILPALAGSLSWDTTELIGEGSLGGGTGTCELRTHGYGNAGSGRLLQAKGQDFPTRRLAGSHVAEYLRFRFAARAEFRRKCGNYCWTGGIGHVFPLPRSKGHQCDHGHADLRR